MNTKEVVVISTGIANTASIKAAFQRLGYSCWLCSAPEVVSSCARVVLPGVGAFGAGMSYLQNANLIKTLRERIKQNLPTLAICLGLQLLCSESEETPGVAGMGILGRRIKRFSTNLKVPQLGWNEVLPNSDCKLLQPGFAYFANSYCLQDAPLDFHVATSTYGQPFIAALEKSRILACQFHPELSGKWGLELLERWAALSDN